MRMTAKMIGAMLLLLAAGCVRSLHPLYTEQDIIFDANLVGLWSGENMNETWEFSKQNENAYQLVYTDIGGKPAWFDVQLLKIGGNLFLDLFPQEPKLIKNAFYKGHLFRVHTFAHVAQIEPTLQLRFPDPDWLTKLVADDPKAIRHERRDNEILLTASTRELQTFWLMHLDTKGAFGLPSELNRKTKVVPVD